MITTTLSTDTPERTTPQLTGTFLDESGTPVQPATAVLTLYDESSLAIINGRASVDILASVTAGVLAWRMTQDDTAVRNTGHPFEWHVMRIDWSWGSSPTLHQKQLIRQRIINVALLP